MSITGNRPSDVNSLAAEPLRPLPPFGEIDPNLPPLPPIGDALAWMDRLTRSGASPARIADREAADPAYLAAVAMLPPTLEYRDVVAVFDRLGITTTGHQG